MKNQKNIRETAGTMFSVMILLGIAATLLMLCFTDFMLKLLNTPQEALSAIIICTVFYLSGRWKNNTLHS